MAKINLGLGYFIETDSLNYTLKQNYVGVGKDDNPKEMTKVIGYYGNMTHAVEECVKSICQNETLAFDGDIQTYAEVIDKIAKNAVSLISKRLEANI